MTSGRRNVDLNRTSFGSDLTSLGGNVILLFPTDYDGELPTVEIDSTSSVLGNLLVDHRVTLIVNGTIRGETERVSP